MQKSEESLRPDTVGDSGVACNMRGVMKEGRKINVIGEYLNIYCLQKKNKKDWPPTSNAFILTSRAELCEWHAVPLQWPSLHFLPRTLPVYGASFQSSSRH